jgi:CRP-like cAMP-binding protein
MELTLESAFSTGGLVGHTSYLLLVISMLMRQINLLRMLVIASAFVAIAYDAIWLKDPVGIFWETLLVAVNIVQLSITYFENRVVRFTDEEDNFCSTRLAELERGERRRLLNKGLWVTGLPGTMLTREGEAVSHLVYLASGRVNIESAGHTVATCEPGSFIGEMTVFDGEAATGTAVVATEARYWMIEANLLRELADKRPETGQALQRSFAQNLKDKLIQSNTMISTLSHGRSS